MTTGLALSPLGFGCASVMGKVGRRQALRAMEEAFDRGITHFDVARSYGFGRAEEVLGEFLRGRRGQVTVATKFGVVPPHLSAVKRGVIPVVRVLTGVLPGLRAGARRGSASLLAQRRFDAGYARECLHTSLRLLGTDHVDCFLLHEPEPSVLAGDDELRRTLEDFVRAGKVRQWGWAFGSAEDDDWACERGGGVVQFECNLATEEASRRIAERAGSHARVRIAMRPFGGGSDFAHQWTARLERRGLTGEAARLRATPAELSIAWARRMAGEGGSVLCAMFDSAHIAANVAAVQRCAGDDAFMRLVDALMRPEVAERPQACA